MEKPLAPMNNHTRMVSKPRQKHLATGAGGREGIGIECDKYPPSRSPLGLTSNKVFEATLGKPWPRFRIGNARYWSLLASAPLVPLPPLCHFWKMLHSDSINRIKNNYSQAEKAKSGKTAKFLRT